LLSFAYGKREIERTPEGLINSCLHFARLLFENFPEWKDALVTGFEKLVDENA
jgi:hypothetical protein